MNALMPSIAGIRLEFILFALTLLGVAVTHKRAFWVAIGGMTVVLAYKLIFDPGFHLAHHLLGSRPLLDQILHKGLREGEWAILLNLLGLLLGFAVLARIFEESGVPEVMPRLLPDDWRGPFALLAFVFVLSSFLDNIAGALIGGTVALAVFDGRVHLGYLAAIVAASNAGGAGSVVGDTTTTMMWIDGVSPINVLHAYVAAGAAFLFFAFFASRQQDRHRRIEKDPRPGARIDWGRLAVVGLILAGAILGNVLLDLPAVGVWIAIVLGRFLRPVPWKEARGALLGAAFLLSLVMCASLMPVEELPPASWHTAFALGFVSAVFDNIPLTKLCLDQGCYDWGMLAYAVGFGGSMIWFGSSAGVALCSRFPEGRDVLGWLRQGWHVAVAYVIGFFVLLALCGWEPGDTREMKASECPARLGVVVFPVAHTHTPDSPPPGKTGARSLLRISPPR
ncbi:MAG: SLC13 family permease [Deltaproteobacteria bacterium]|nr:SLC13 family permease [Deltaproteobacteria bacterium]